MASAGATGSPEEGVRKKPAPEGILSYVLQMRAWRGTVRRLKMGPVMYEVAQPDKGKASQVYHINLLKEWMEHEPAKVLLVR